MRVILFGATGMVGQGVLRECLSDSRVERVLAVVRRSSGLAGGKVEELVHSDVFDFSSIAPRLAGWDACFFCLGVSSAGMTEADYRRVTYDITLAAATELSRANPGMIFIYVSGAGTDSTERGRTMWARVKGATENALLALPLSACMFRPAIIVPLHGIVSKTRSYRIFYAVFRPFLPALRGLFPGLVTTTEEMGRAMLEVAAQGPPKPVLESRDIRRLGGEPARS
ncbi:MAG TPA: NAD(P)H-binding protein [Thermoanaerobaculia bacterium]|nr:NAD(P)H-binding protein [Thermoanaerobaculia bacterium]